MATDLQFSPNVMSATGNLRNCKGRVSWGQWEPCCSPWVGRFRGFRGRDAHPDLPYSGLELAAVITSSEDKAGHDAATFAKLDALTGKVATTDIDAALGDCDAVADVEATRWA